MCWTLHAGMHQTECRCVLCPGVDHRSFCTCRCNFVSFAFLIHVLRTIPDGFIVQTLETRCFASKNQHVVNISRRPGIKLDCKAMFKRTDKKCSLIQLTDVLNVILRQCKWSTQVRVFLSFEWSHANNYQCQNSAVKAYLSRMNMRHAKVDV